MITILLGKIIELLTSSFSSIKTKLQTMYNNIQPPTLPRFWVLNPEPLNNSHFSEFNKGKSYVAYSASTNYSSADTPVCNGTTTFNGTTQPVIYRTGKGIGTIYFLNKIPHGFYKKLFVECEITADGTSYINSRIILANTDMILDENLMPENRIKEIFLVASNKTVEEINNQDGVTINSTDNLLLDAQTVEIDVSDINEDYYITVMNCDRKLAIRSIYLE